MVEADLSGRTEHPTGTTEAGFLGRDQCTQQDRAESGVGGGPHHTECGSSTHSAFVLQRRSVNVWRHIWLSQLGSATGIWW